MAIYNHLLFSEIFFQQIRQETTDLDNLRATLSTIRATWQYYLPPPSGWDGPTWKPSSRFSPDDVVQLRANIVEQIFAYLELTYGPSESAGSTALTSDQTFFLYADWSQQDRTGLCLVLPYSADIEGRDPDTDIIPKGRNYAQQLIRLLNHYNLDWGVLTNGRHWRLFHRAELSPTETYLHVDLEHVIVTEDVQDYIVFHRFFSRPAFARQDGRQRLDVYKQQSDKATEIIEDHLSAHVEEIARQLCQGLVESCRAAGEDVTAPETRTAIYKNALFLIYRLLFILYAEARDLLPLDVPAYRAVCLRDLLSRVRGSHKQGMNFDGDYAIWERLQALFALIDQGDLEAGVPAYNGGLFDPGRRPFLTGHALRNEYLQVALIRLATLPAKGQTYDQDRDPRPIDYRDLSVRHLGSLYEGLLEYNLFVVEDEPRVVRTSRKKTRYVPYSQAGKVRANETVLPVGAVYFSETEGERKATGSYYTPEDVVDYIVRNTVGKKLPELRAEFYQDQAIERQLADLADTPADVPAHRQIRAALDEQFLRFVHQKVLDLKILDPAMGSGHFLVNATHTAANFVVELLNETPWENAAIDTDVATWKRQVAERCIFGVDLNELAVELAKLCLWMTTAAKGKPLTFLDHHLRWGNSLVGARMRDIGVYPLAKKESRQKFTLPLERFQVELDEVLAAYETLHAKSSDDVDQVREKARIFEEEIHPILEPYRELLDLHTGVYFRNGLDEETYAKLGAAVADPHAWARLKAQSLSGLLREYTDRHWLHWELEFPEVFRSNKPGFDVILGNPPYGRYGVLDNEERQFVRQKGYAFGSGDSSEAFSDHALELTQTGGLTSFIIPKSFTFVGSWNGIRERLISDSRLKALCDVSEAFETVLLEQVIFTSQSRKCPRAEPVFVDSILSLGRHSRIEVDRNLFTTDYFPTYVTPVSLAIARQIWQRCRPISHYCYVWYGKGGATPYLNTVRKGVPVLRGKEVNRYAFRTEYEPCYLPKEFCTQVEITQDSQRKIVAQDIVAFIQNPFPHIQLAASIDENHRLCLNTLTCFAVKDNDYSLEMILAVLNSRLISWYVHRFIFNGAVRTMHFMPGYADRWPMVDIDSDVSPHNHDQILRELGILIQNGALTTALERIDAIKNDQARLVVIHDTLAMLAGLMLASRDNQVDYAIDQLVYKLYGVKPSHIELIEQGII